MRDKYGNFYHCWECEHVTLNKKGEIVCKVDNEVIDHDYVACESFKEWKGEE
jgi:hypothetical protein